MPRAKLLLDTNIVIDYIDKRLPYYQQARLLMMCGRVGEYSLWLSSSQVTDLVYILSEGGRSSEMSSVLEKLRGLRTFVNVFPVADREIDQMLATSWKDPEDALLLEVALRMKADALITRNPRDFETNLIKVFDCDEFFAWVRDEYDIDYAEVDL